MDNNGNPMPSASWPLKLFCQSVDDGNNTLGPLFAVDTSSTAVVADSKKKFSQRTEIPSQRAASMLTSSLCGSSRQRYKSSRTTKRIRHLTSCWQHSSTIQHQSPVKLNPAFRVSRYFSVNPPEEHLHLIVQVPAFGDEQRNILTPLRNLSLSSPRRRIGYTASSLRSKQKTNVETVNSMRGPSSAAKPAYLLENNDGPNPVIRNLRPSHARGPPISLFHDVFAQFVRDSANVTVPTSSQYIDTIVRFMAAATALYKNEDARQNAISPLLEELVGCRFRKFDTNNDAHIDDASHVDEIFCTLIAEYKNEIGTGGTDGSIQVSFGHAKWAAQNRVC